MPFLFGYFKFTHLGLILGKLGFAPPIVAIRAMLLKGEVRFHKVILVYGRYIKRFIHLDMMSGDGTF